MNAASVVENRTDCTDASSLFKQLQSLACYVARESTILGADVNHTTGHQPQLYDSVASKLVKNVLELEELSQQLEDKSRTFKKVADFVASAENVLQERLHHTKRIEAYLQKYGYVPVKSDVTSASLPALPSNVLAPTSKLLSPELDMARTAAVTDSLLPSTRPATLQCSSVGGVDTVSEDALLNGTSRPKRTVQPLTSAPVTAKQVPRQVVGQTSAFKIPEVVIHEPVEVSAHEVSSLANANKQVMNSAAVRQPLRRPVPSCASTTATSVGGSNSSGQGAWITPNTKRSVETWLHGVHVDQPGSPSPLHYSLPKRQINPLLQGCPDVGTPFRRVGTSAKRMVTSASPELSVIKEHKTSVADVKICYNIESSLNSKSKMECANINTREIELKTSFRRNCEMKPAKLVPSPKVLQGTSCDTSMDEPILSEVTLNVLAELKKIREQKSIATESSDFSGPSLVSKISASEFVSPLNQSECTDQPIDYSCKVPDLAVTEVLDLLVKTFDDVFTTRSTLISVESRSDTPEEPRLMSDYANHKVQSLVDTPEEPVLSSEYMKMRCEHVTKAEEGFDTPEEPVLTSDYGKLTAAYATHSVLLQTNSSNKTDGEQHVNQLPLAPLFDGSDSNLQLLSPDKAIVSENKRWQLLLEDDQLDKSPDLSEFTKQFLFHNKQISASSVASQNACRGIFSKENSSVTSEKENKPPGDGYLSDSLYGREHISKLEPNFFAIPRAAACCPKPKFDSKNTTTDLDSSELDFSRSRADESSLQLDHSTMSATGHHSRRSVCNNSFSQAMLQYSHVKASPMPNRSTSRLTIPKHQNE